MDEPGVPVLTFRAILIQTGVEPHPLGRAEDAKFRRTTFAAGDVDHEIVDAPEEQIAPCLLYTSPSPRD